MQLYKGLFVFEIYSLLAAFQWPPGKSGFQVARCIAVYSNTFLYNMKANRDLKNDFWWKTTRWFFWGVLSCFRGTATYANRAEKNGIKVNIFLVDSWSFSVLPYHFTYISTRQCFNFWIVVVALLLLILETSIFTAVHLTTWHPALFYQWNQKKRSPQNEEKSLRLLSIFLLLGNIFIILQR